MSLSTGHEQLCDLDTTRRCELEDNLEILRNTRAFAGIPLERLKLYAYLSKRLRFRAGDFVFRQGDEDERGYIIISGKVQIVREYEDRSLFLEELSGGEFFGGLALLAKIKRLFSVKTVTRAELLTLDRQSFQKLFLQFPEVAIKVLEVMIKRIARMEEKLLSKRMEECFYK